GRRRLHLDRPAQEGHDHRRRLQRVSVGRRRCPLHASGRAARRRHRHSGHLSRRDRESVRRIPSRRQRDDRGAARALPREPRRIQSAAADRNPRYAADERRRQDPVSRAAGRARRGGCEIMTTIDTRQGLTGLDYFKKVLAGEFAPPPMLQMLGIKFVEVEYGRVVLTATVEERFYNGTGVAHGGFAATLMDTALGCAINTTTPAGKRFTTLELKVN